MKPQNTKFHSYPSNDFYMLSLPVWKTVDDCIAGQDAVKARGQLYLHKTVGMKTDKKWGDDMYEGYKYRADWRDYPSDFLIKLFGLLWQAEPTVYAPKDMKENYLSAPSYIRDKSFMDVYRDTSINVIKYDRHGILLDVPSEVKRGANVYPVMIQYDTRKIVNWGYRTYKGQEVVSFIVLDESYYDYENSTLMKVEKRKYRFLGLKTRTDDDMFDLEQPMYYTYTSQDAFRAIFNPPAPTDGNYVIDYMGELIVYPNIAGRTAPSIPFFSFTSTAMELEPGKPIIYPICKAALSYYRTGADYEQALYKQSFALLFGTGMEMDDIYIGTEKAITVNSPDANLRYVQIGGQGISEQRMALENKASYAAQVGFDIISANNDRTGESVKNSLALKTASLKSIAKTLASGFVTMLKFAAAWRGSSDADVTSISINPNMEFAMSHSYNVASTNYSIFSGQVVGMTLLDYYNKLRENGDTIYTTYEEWEKAMKSAQEARYEQARRMNDATNTKVLNEAKLQVTDHIDDKLQPKDLKSNERTQQKKEQRERNK